MGLTPEGGQTQKHRVPAQDLVYPNGFQGQAHARHYSSAHAHQMSTDDLRLVEEVPDLPMAADEHLSEAQRARQRETPRGARKKYSDNLQPRQMVMQQPMQSVQSMHSMQQPQPM